MGGQQVALVTGASRGIGKATALALAEAGFDVAMTARTMREGEGRDDSDTGGGRPVPGSLETTAAEVERRARRALPLVADLLDHESLRAAVRRVLAEWGRVDVLVNNAVETGDGSMTRLLDTTIEQFERKVRANYLAQLVVLQEVLPAMLAAGGGRVVDVTSYSASHDPERPAGDGGWGLAYAGAKAAFHRIAGIVAVELGGQGIRAFNVDPGYVLTERQLENSRALGLEGHFHGAPPSAPAAAIAWLATAPEAEELSGQTVNGLKLALDRGLHPDWRVRPAR